jgi:hypothetical protein
MLLPDSGPAVARAFHSVLGAVFVVAFVSLALQLDLLFTAGGLAPIADAMTRADAFWRTPTVFWWSADDLTLQLAAVLGALFGALAMIGGLGRPGRLVRPCLALATVLYLGFAAVGAPFLNFQWDNLLLECGLLAVLLPRRRPAPLVHALFAALLLKLYFESGLAKWYSPLGDWHDGSAMTFYYETAPIPTRLAWYAHHLPAAWHAFEGWFMLAAELVLPLLIFAGRRPRLVVFAALTGFQIINIATANYGFFCWLALALHLFLLRDDDLARLHHALARLPRWLLPPPVPSDSPDPAPGPLARGLLGGFAALWLAVSLLEGLARFTDVPRWHAWSDALAPLHRPLRAINTYHLFAQITRDRIEPEFLALADDAVRPLALRFKPGPLDRPPPFVAPHQPRLDFQLWFYGLAMQRSPPRYVVRLLAILCHDPARARQAFATPLPDAPTAVQLRFWRYTFTPPGAADWWQRAPLGAPLSVRCSDLPRPEALE